jgi:flagellin
MALGVLNNISSLAAENELTLTSNALSNTLEQLSSGSRINSGADDPAGLSIANGLEANIAALTQSVSNANDGVGELQLADGALAQVTNLLNTAVTLATESATGTVSNGQRTAIQAQYASILSEINQIGTATTYNGQSVFQSGTAPNLNEQNSPAAAGTLNLNSVLTSGDATSVTAGGITFTYTAGATTGANPNEVTGTATNLTSAATLTTGAVLTLTRASGTSTYTAAAGATVGSLLTAINTGAGTDITVAGGDAHTNYQAQLVGGALQVTDLNNNGDVTAVETADTNTNQVQNTTTVTGASTIAATGVITLTRAGLTSIYTVAAGGTTVSALEAVINAGTANSTVGNIVITGTDTARTNYSATINPAGHLQITDAATTDADLTVAQTVTAELGTFADTTDKTLGNFTANTTATSTVQNLINAINSDTTVGAKAALVSGTLEITDPLNRADLAVTTDDTVLGAPVAGAPTAFTTPNTVGASTPNTNQLVGNATGLTLITALTSGKVTSFTVGSKTFTYTAGGASTVGSLINAINTPSTDAAGLNAYLNSTGSLVVTDPNDDGNIAVNSTNTETVLGTYANPTTTGSTTTNIFLSDSTAIGSAQIAVNIGGLSTTGITNGSGGQAINLATTDLNTQGDAQTALTLLNSAITNVASVRGTLGASVNRLTAASNVLNSQIQNLTSAENTITAADIPTVVANLTKYSILEQTGISALAQANQQQQLVLKLLQ